MFSDKEKDRMVADIVENVKDCKIDLQYSSKNEGWTYSKPNNEWGISKHEVRIGKIKGIEQFTLLNNEFGHILFDSPISSGTQMIEQWSDAWASSPAHGNLYRETIFQTYWCALNILEDERIETLMGKLWLKNSDRFAKTKKSVGKIHLDNELKTEKGLRRSPIQTLLGVRFMRNKAVEKDDTYNLVKKLLDDVKTASPHGTLVCVRILKPHIDMWLTDMIEKDKKIRQKLKKAQEEYATCPLGDKSSKIEPLRKKRDKLRDELKENKKAINPPEINTSTSNMFKEDNPVDSNDLHSDVIKFTDPEYVKQEDQRQKELKTTLEQDKKDGKESLQEIKDMLSTGIPRGKDEILEDSNIRDIGAQGSPLGNIADGMNKIFKKMSEIPKRVVGYEGDEIDIESYIEGKIRMENIEECLIDTKYIRGASVLLSVDASCSMNNYRGSMNKARDLVATLYKSIEGIDNINLKCILWSSNRDGVMNVTNVNSLKDTNKMYVTRSFCLTPTHIAIKHSVSIMKGMKGRKKLLIIITDGYPRYYHKRKRVMTNILVKMTRKAFLRGLRKCPNIMAMLIEPTPGSKEYSKEIFGKKLMVVSGMEDGSEVIVKRFKRLVMEVLK